MNDRNNRKRVWAAVAVLGGAMVLAGCRNHMPHAFTLGTGDLDRTHAKPAEGGYYSNWDPYAATLEVTPLKDVNPVRTQHVLVATVKDQDGNPLPNRRVEWIIANGSVGDIVEVDESGWRASRGHKQTNRYAVSHTNNLTHVLDRGNDDPSDDIHLTKGQTWCVITSAVEGTTHVVAYAPGIYDWSKHKVFADKHWFDVAWKFPPAATNPIGTPHRLATTVTKHSDGTPLAGYEVTYRIVDGPAAKLSPGDGQTATVKTDKNGVAAVTLNQASPVEGTNGIQIDILRPGNKECCEPASHIMTGHTKKVWIGPKIAITKDAPARAVLGQKFRYDIVVSNPSDVAATNTVLTDQLPAGIRYASSAPPAKVAGQNLTWALGTLAAQGKKSVSITVTATRTGRFVNPAQVRADQGLNARDDAVTVVTQPKLAVKKTAPATVLICEPIPYTVTVTNTGDAPASNVKLRDELPAGLLWKGNKVVTADIGTLAPGQSKQVSYAANASKGGTFVNKAVATGDGGLKAEDTARTVVQEPKLLVDKTAPAKRFVDRSIVYEITVTNTGNGVAGNTVLVDPVPAGTRFVSATGGGKLSGGKVIWNLGDLAPKASKKMSLTLKATARGIVRNTATATAKCTQASKTVQTEIAGIPAILLECVDLEDPIEVGTNVTYVITVTNQGSADGTNIVIKCTLPAQQAFVSAAGPTKEAVKGKVITFAPLKRLAPKAKATYRLIVKGTGVGDVRFRVSLTSDQMTSPAGETESTHIYK